MILIDANLLLYAKVKEYPSHRHARHLVSDAHLVSLAIEQGLTLQSTDGDFARFLQLHWQNPLRKKTARRTPDGGGGAWRKSPVEPHS